MGNGDGGVPSEGQSRGQTEGREAAVSTENSLTGSRLLGQGVKLGLLFPGRKGWGEGRGTGWGISDCSPCSGLQKRARQGGRAGVLIRQLAQTKEMGSNESLLSTKHLGATVHVSAGELQGVMVENLTCVTMWKARGQLRGTKAQVRKLGMDSELVPHFELWSEVWLLE